MAAAFAAGSHLIHILLSGPVILTETALDENVDNRAVDRTIPAVYWLIPHASVWEDTVFVVTPTQTTLLMTMSSYLSMLGTHKDMSNTKSVKTT